MTHPPVPIKTVIKDGTIERADAMKGCQANMRVKAGFNQRVG
jgi:hypothetical protein